MKTKILSVKIKIILVFFIFSSYNLFSQHHFTQNKGQLPKQVFAKANLPGGTLFLEKGKFLYTFFDTDKLYEIHSNRATDNHINTHSFETNFLGILDTLNISFENESDFYENYYIGGKDFWANNVKSYQSYTQKNIYENIDLKVYFKDKNLKYDFIIQPHADPSQIKWEYSGITSSDIQDDNLIIKNTLNTIIEKKPFAYQLINNDTVQVECGFQVKKNQYYFNIIGEYDKDHQLIIDPELIFSTYSGSTADNFGYTATFDQYGFLYSGSTSFGPGYPTTLGAYQINFNGGVGGTGTDIAITKYDTTGSTRIYSTYLGGSMDELPHSMIVNTIGEIYILGTTGSEDYPVTSLAFDTNFNGGNSFSPQGIGVSFPNGSDIIVSKISGNGGALISSTFLGGTSNDGLNIATKLRYNYADEARGEIEVDNYNNIYIASCTRSIDFPVKNAIQSTSLGGQDGCLVKMSGDLSNIIWSTYFSGTKDDALYSLSIDLDNDIIVAGGTNSSDLPITNLAYQPNYLDSLNADAFVAKFNSSGTQIIASTYFGSNKYDQAYFVESSKSKDIYIFGQTKSQDSSLIVNSNYQQLNGGQFISVFDSSLSILKRSTVFGSGKGTPDISPTAFLVDLCNRIYVSGWGSSLSGGTLTTLNLPVTNDAFQNTTDGNDFYLMVMNDFLDSLSYATYFGGSQSSEHVDGGTSRFDRKGIIYQSVCAGCGGNSDFPIFPTTNVVSSTNNSLNCNNGVFKFKMNFPMIVADFDVPLLSCEQTIQFTNLSTNQDTNTYLWNFGDGFTSTQKNPTHTYLTSGEFHVTLIAHSPSSCNLFDTIFKTIYILSDSTFNLSDKKKCRDTEVQIGINPYSQLATTYSWQPSTNLDNPNISNPYTDINVTTEYSLIINIPTTSTVSGCTDTLKQKIIIDSTIVDLQEDTTYCNQPITLSANQLSSTNIIWSSNSNFSDTLSLFDTLNVFSTGKFFVKVASQHCSVIDSVSVENQSINVSLSGIEEICKGDTAIIQINNFNPNVEIEEYSWNPENVIYVNDSSIILDAPEFSKWYSVVIINEEGCVYSDSFFVVVNEPPIIDSMWSSESIIYKGQSTMLHVLTNDNVLWENDELTNNTIVFPEISKYHLVNVYNEHCSLKDSIYVEVINVFCDQSGIIIPNAFSPNEDELNDRYRIIDQNQVITKFKIEIFNRVGQKVYSSKNINEGWDGYFKGERQFSQVFDYYLEIECYGNKKLFKKGNITLVK